MACTQSEDGGEPNNSCPQGTPQDGLRFHHASQNSMQCKTQEWCLSGVFSSNTFRLCGLRVAEPLEKETADEGDDCPVLCV